MPLLSKDDILLVVLIAALAVTIYSGPGTVGFYVSKVLNVTLYVNESYKGCAYPITTPHSVLYDSDTFFFSSIENCGTKTLEGRVYTEIRNSSGFVVDSIISSEYSLLPGQWVEYNTTWRADRPLGVYSVHRYDNVTNHTTEANTTFRIYCMNNSLRCFGNDLMACSNETEWLLLETCSYLCVNGTCIPPEAPAAPAPSGVGGYARIDAEYPDNISVQQGESTIFFVKAINNGTLKLTNIYLYIESSGIRASTPPVVAAELIPGESVSFVVDVNASDTNAGTYNITWIIVSDHVSKKGAVRVIVKEGISEEQGCRSMIDYYFGLIDYLEREIRKAELQERNVEDARQELQGAVQKLAAAEELRDMGFWKECTEQEAVIREFLKRAGILLAKAKTRPVQIITVINLTDVLYILLIAILVALIVIVILRKSSKKESLRRMLYKLDYF